MSLLILGASARAAASSARRAGLVPTGIDLFADRDLAAVARAIPVAPADYPDGLAAHADGEPPGPWIYTGALENHPDLIDRIAARRPLWGIGGDPLRAVRDPIAVADRLRRAGLPCPGARLDPAGLPRDGSWLVKPIASAGGQGIRPLGPRDEASRRPSYYQERVAGPSRSAIFLGVRSGATLEGVTQQWVGRTGADFAYVGSIGPRSVTESEAGRIRTLGDSLARAFGLVGLFGVDFILRDGIPWPVEVNPRYTASVEVLELALGYSLLAAHRRACETAGPPASMPVTPPPGRAPIVGKLILFAAETCRFPDLDPGPVASADPYAVPAAGDVPRPGTVIEAGWPVMTLFESGRDEETCRRRLERRRSDWERTLRASALDDGGLTGS